MELFQQLSAVAFVLILTLAVVWLLRKGRGAAFKLPWPTATRGAERDLRLLDRLVLTPQHCLHLVQVQDAKYLVTTHAAGATMVPLDGTADFGKTFQQALRRDPAQGSTS